MKHFALASGKTKNLTF